MKTTATLVILICLNVLTLLVNKQVTNLPFGQIEPELIIRLI